jgi:hypothetical protein
MPVTRYGRRRPSSQTLPRARPCEPLGEGGLCSDPRSVRDRAVRIQSASGPHTTHDSHTQPTPVHPGQRGRAVVRAGGADEPACTPGSVPGRLAAAGRRPSLSGCRCRQPPAAYPQASDGPSSSACAGGRRTGLPLGLAPGGVYRAARVASGAGGLLHHRFTLTATADRGGGLLSVALSRGSPRVGVTHHPALWSPDVPRRRRRVAPVTPTRPPGRLVRRTPQGT